MTRLVHRLLFNLLLPVLASAVSLDLLFTYGRSERRSARRGAGPGDLGRPHGPQPRLLRARAALDAFSGRRPLPPQPHLGRCRAPLRLVLRLRRGHPTASTPPSTAATSPKPPPCRPTTALWSAMAAPSPHHPSRKRVPVMAQQ
ncbi:hypothetical protein GW17_00057757 [Ensete ventricosum]|nr:hypothetical protein GW17_00057757 [Ensete ventricosum]